MNFRDRLRKIAADIAGPDDADDVIHDAFCRLWSRHPLVEDSTHALRLSFTAVRHTAIDSYRHSHAHPTVPIDESPPPDDSDERHREEQRATYDAVIRISRKALSPRQFEIFSMHDIQGAGYDEIAETLGITPENVRMILSRSRKIIREIYRKQNI